MGHRSYLVDLDAGVKIYLHWAAAVLHDLKRFDNLTEKVKKHLEGNAPTQNWFKGMVGALGQAAQSAKSDGEPEMEIAVSSTATGKYTIEDENVEEYTDMDAVEDFDVWIEAIFVAKDEEIVRAYTDLLMDNGDGTSEKVFFKIDSQETLNTVNHIEDKLYHYHSALSRANINNPAKKALTYVVHDAIKLNQELKIPCSTVEPEHPVKQRDKRKLRDIIKNVDPDQKYVSPQHEEKTDQSSSKKTKNANDDEKYDQHLMKDHNRKKRAKEEEMKIERLVNNRYKVKDKYVVDLDDPSCTCPDHQHRNTKCKHIIKVEEYIKEK